MKEKFCTHYLPVDFSNNFGESKIVQKDIVLQFFFPKTMVVIGCQFDKFGEKSKKAKNNNNNKQQTNKQTKITHTKRCHS